MMLVSPEVLGVLRSAVAEGQTLRIPGVVARDLYLKTDRVLREAGGRWGGAKSGHVFPGDAGAVLDEILTTGRVFSERKALGQFYTPPDLAAHLVERAAITAGERMLEPSAGRGALAAPATGAGALVDCIEIDPANVAALTEAEMFASVRRADFLACDVVSERAWGAAAPGAFPGYDLVVMNPPFAGGADIDHVTRAIGLLRPGGRLLAVMSASVMFREAKRWKALDAFRELVAHHGGTLSELPERSFRSVGTGVATILCEISERRDA
ncbi:hypothetical protein [Xanthobacter flavus]|uniref:hypothetical protein n=1 Tax=Xanthobacter flavus TaxID=281 RepID=UPI00372C52F4